MENFEPVHLLTARLQLRPLMECDAAELFALRNDPELNRHTGNKPWASMESAHRRIAEDRDAMRNGEAIRLAIAPHDSATMIGSCALFQIDSQCRRAEIGYGMLQPWWGQGLMQEALYALIEFGFTELNLNRIEADVDPDNIASLKALDRLGFRREGLLRERWIVHGAKTDSVLLGLLAADWAQHRKSIKPA